MEMQYWSNRTYSLLREKAARNRGYMPAKQRTFFRYMDDIVVISNSRQEMEQLRIDFQSFCEREMGLRLSKWSVQPASRGVNFLGYRIWPTHKLMRRQSVVKAKRKIKRYASKGEHDQLRKFMASWRGHAKWADSKNLIKTLEKHHERHANNHQHAS